MKNEHPVFKIRKSCIMLIFSTYYYLFTLPDIVWIMSIAGPVCVVVTRSPLDPWVSCSNLGGVVGIFQDKKNSENGGSFG